MSTADDYLDPQKLADRLAYVEGNLLAVCMALANVLDELGPAQRESFERCFKQNIERIEASTLGLPTPAAEENIRGMHGARDTLIGSDGDEAPSPTAQSGDPPDR